MRNALLPFLTVSLIVSASAATTMPPASNIKIDFDKHVLPILSEKCFGCHGPRQQQSGLRLDKRQNALRGGDYGPVILPGNSSQSKLILRLVGGDGGMQMPPTGALSADEIGILRAWIDQGGEFGDVKVKEEKPAKPVDPKLTRLITAVRAKDGAMVSRMLDSDAGLAKEQDASGSTALHHAAGFSTVAIMQMLLDHGADVNARNRLNCTPLHWAYADAGKARLLLERGANVNVKAYDGKTPLYLAALQHNSDAVLLLLLAHHADPAIATLNGRTPLMAASAAGSVPAMKMLIENKAGVNTASGTGSVPLMDAAASGNVAAVRLLLDRGADVNALTKRKMSALSIAAMEGSEDIVRVLLEHGAEVNFQDVRGYSPLMYAAYCETMPAGIVRLLLANGARKDYEGEGETAMTLAGKRGDNEVARMLGVEKPLRESGGVVMLPVRETGNRSAAEAVELAVAVLSRQSPNFVKRGGCNSCHNQSLPSAALSMAREHGVRVPASIVQLPPEMMERSADRTMDMGVIGVNSVGYEVFGYGMSRRPADDYTDSLVHYLKAMQTPEGRWLTTGSRPPLTSDHIQTTAMAIYALRTYSTASEKADTAARLARAAAWLASARAVTTQERAYQVLGLAWSNAGKGEIENAARELARMQRPDGGWSQLPSMGSDAYATGEALLALGMAAGRTLSDPVFGKGVQYLLGTQAGDGSWHVKTRSLPFQPYFESGFPYAHDQWISAAGTSYAAMALSLAVEPRQVTSR